MQTEITLGGGIDSLLTHMTMLGSALIAEDAGLRNVRIHWTDASVPRATIAFSGSGAEELAQALRALALRVSDPTSWTRVMVDVGGKVPAAAFNGKSGTPNTPERWAALAAARAAGLGNVSSRLELRLARSLGQQAWWFDDHKQFRPANGASAWEMRTRNRGLQFLPDRFIPLAEEVVQWPDDKIVSGLRGETIDDAVGKNAFDSRTATGLTAPQPVDNAVALAALIGLAAIPLIHSTTQSTVSAAHIRRHEDRSARLLMPVSVEPVSAHRIRAMLRSSWLIEVADHEAENSEPGPLTRRSALDRLASLGAAAVVSFPVQVSSNVNAPERIALAGEVFPCRAR